MERQRFVNVSSNYKAFRYSRHTQKSRRWLRLPSCLPLCAVLHFIRCFIFAPRTRATPSAKPQLVVWAVGLALQYGSQRLRSNPFPACLMPGQPRSSASFRAACNAAANQPPTFEQTVIRVMPAALSLGFGIFS